MLINQKKYLKVKRNEFDEINIELLNQSVNVDLDTDNNAEYQLLVEKFYNYQQVYIKICYFNVFLRLLKEFMTLLIILI